VSGQSNRCSLSGSLFAPDSVFLIFSNADLNGSICHGWPEKFYALSTPYDVIWPLRSRRRGKALICQKCRSAQYQRCAVVAKWNL
jgi:hypothetical protein